MRDCICCQCAEYQGQFSTYIQCECCDRYGTEDNFDDSEVVCGDCVKFLEDPNE